MATSTKKATKAKASTKVAGEEGAKAAPSEPTKEEAGKTGPSIATDAKANPMSDPESHAVSPAEMAALRPGAAKDESKASALAASDTATAERLESESADRKAEEDNSTFGRLSRSGLVLNENQNTGERWVGISIQQDPDASHSDKLKTRITPLAEVKPFRGLTVKPERGEPFALGDEFDKDATPAMWLGVINPGTKKSLIQ